MFKEASDSLINTNSVSLNNISLDSPEDCIDSSEDEDDLVSHYSDEAEDLEGSILKLRQLLEEKQEQKPQEVEKQNFARSMSDPSKSQKYHNFDLVLRTFSLKNAETIEEIEVKM